MYKFSFLNFQNDNIPKFPNGGNEDLLLEEGTSTSRCLEFILAQDADSCFLPEILGKANSLEVNKISNKLNDDSANILGVGTCFGIEDYTLDRSMPDYIYFKLQIRTRPPRSKSDICLTASEVFDREQREIYSIGIIASDGGFPSQTAKLNITVHGI